MASIFSRTVLAAACIAAAGVTGSALASDDASAQTPKRVVVSNKGSAIGAGSMVPRVSIAPRPAPSPR